MTHPCAHMVPPRHACTTRRHGVAHAPYEPFRPWYAPAGAAWQQHWHLHQHQHQRQHHPQPHSPVRTQKAWKLHAHTHTHTHTRTHTHLQLPRGRFAGRSLSCHLCLCQCQHLPQLAGLCARLQDSKSAHTRLGQHSHCCLGCCSIPGGVGRGVKGRANRHAGLRAFM